MAKFTSGAEMMAAWEEMGITVSDEMREAAQTFDRSLYFDKALTILSGDETHVGKVDEKDAEDWVNRLFELASDIRENFVTEEIGKQGRGDGRQNRALVKLQTPAGTLQVMLTYDVSADE